MIYNRSMGISLAIDRMRVVAGENFLDQPLGAIHPDRRKPVHDMLYMITGRREVIKDGVRYAIEVGDVLLLAEGRDRWANVPAPMSHRIMYLSFLPNPRCHAAHRICHRTHRAQPRQHRIPRCARGVARYTGEGHLGASGILRRISFQTDLQETHWEIAHRLSQRSASRRFCHLRA